MNKYQNVEIILIATEMKDTCVNLKNRTRVSKSSLKC